MKVLRIGGIFLIAIGSFAISLIVKDLLTESLSLLAGGFWDKFWLLSLVALLIINSRSVIIGIQYFLMTNNPGLQLSQFKQKMSKEGYLSCSSVDVKDTLMNKATSTKSTLFYRYLNEPNVFIPGILNSKLEKRLSNPPRFFAVRPFNDNHLLVFDWLMREWILFVK